MKILTSIILLPVALMFVGCGSGGGSNTAPKALPGQPGIAPTPSPTPGLVPTPTPSPTPAPTPFPLTYYTKTVTVNSIPVSGSCVNYSSNSYCWDSGIITTGAGPSHYSFWQVTTAPGMCSGNCLTDYMTSVKVISVNLLNLMANSLGSYTPSQVLSIGVPTTVSCTLSSQILNCVDFSIDLSQVPL